ncbi:hypothetical protein C5964_08810 [Cronobacter sakazakii]|nr:hypothetical protein C5964_08810 [Cronobacter sakazakii]
MLTHPTGCFLPDVSGALCLPTLRAVRFVAGFGLPYMAGALRLPALRARAVLLCRAGKPCAPAV